jgi:hypothetical protein
MKQAVGLPAIKRPNEPRALPRADMNQAFGLEGQTDHNGQIGEDGFSTPTASFIPAQGNALGSSDHKRFTALKARFIKSKVRRIHRQKVEPEQWSDALFPAVIEALP